MQILLIETDSEIAWKMFSAMLASLRGVYPELEIIVSTAKKEGSGKIIHPRLDEIVDIIEESDLIILGEESFGHKIADIIPYCHGKKVITTGANSVNGYNHFSEIESFRTRDIDDPKRLDAMNNLCSLITLTTEGVHD